MFERAKRVLASAPVASVGGITLYRDGRVGRGRERYPVVGVSARVESGSELESRVTATRLVGMGLFAFAAKKKRGGEVWLTVEGPEFFWSVEVSRDDARDARKLAAQVNQQAARALA